MPAGPIGLHTLAGAYIDQDQLVQTLRSADAASPEIIVSLTPLAQADAGLIPPTVTGLTASPLFAGPLAPITFAVEVTAGMPSDPLSADVFLVEPVTHWAGALAPPTPALPGGPYPDGVYNRVVQAPDTPGVYTYSVVAASTAHVSSTPATIIVTITATGSPPPPDAGSFHVDGGGLPDGRH